MDIDITYGTDIDITHGTDIDITHGTGNPSPTLSKFHKNIRNFAVDSFPIIL
jgi:hypothetical protein